MSFPLFRRPGCVAFLDDDAAYLDTLALLLPTHWQVDLFVRPAACINHLQQQPPLWEADAWAQQRIVERWNQGTPLAPQILRYWRNAGARHSLAQVCVVDYAMPGTTGLDSLAELADWPGARVLLTGQADEQIAVDAFNRALIDQFIPKQVAGASRRIVDAVQRLMDRPHPRHAQIWRSTLSAQQSAVLAIPSVNHRLWELAKHHWVEHIVIGQPFGVLGLSATGTVGWLQLEPPSGLDDLADLALAHGCDVATATAIRKGLQLTDVELGLSLGRPGPLRLQPALSIGLGQELVGALFELGLLQPDGVQPSQTPSRPDRVVQD